MESLPLGNSEFRKVRERKLLYVDKTRLIPEILRDSAEVTLLTRPRRFGKTLNLTMLREFLDDREDSRPLFTDLAVSQDPVVMRHCSTYPTLFITFKDLKPHDTESFQTKLALLVSKLCQDHRKRLEAAELYPDERETLARYLQGQAGPEHCEQALAWLSALLYRITGKRVFILIDEYDTPINASFKTPFLPSIIHFMRNFLSAGLKDNPALEKGVLTGILRVAKESIFSGLNNLTVHTLLDRDYSTHFGFTEAEVTTLLETYHMADRMEEFQRWYNGYHMGEVLVYNPWSTLNALKQNSTDFAIYWANNADHELLWDLLSQGAMSAEEIATLLAGQPLAREIEADIHLDNFRPGAIWSLLLHSGLLTAVGKDDQGRYRLVIPNREVSKIFEKTVTDCLGGKSYVDALIQSLLAEDMGAFGRALQEAVIQTLSFFDVTKEREHVYHLFLAGLLTNLHRTHTVLSNRESGHGRLDLALLPHQPGGTGFIMELKQVEHGREDQMEHSLQESAAKALNQIDINDYLAEFRARAVKKVLKLGIAWSRKRLALRFAHSQL